MTNFTENATLLRSTKSKNSNWSVSHGTNANWDFYSIWICTEEFEFLVLVDFVAVAFSVESVLQWTLRTRHPDTGCCSVLQCVAVYCSLMQRVAVLCSEHSTNAIQLDYNSQTPSRYSTSEFEGTVTSKSWNVYMCIYIYVYSHWHHSLTPALLSDICVVKPSRCSTSEFCDKVTSEYWDTVTVCCSPRQWALRTRHPSKCPDTVHLSFEIQWHLFFFEIPWHLELSAPP